MLHRSRPLLLRCEVFRSDNLRDGPEPTGCSDGGAEHSKTRCSGRLPRVSAKPTAVILLAGRSRRTWPLTGRVPKPLLPLWGRPLAERVLDQLQGIVDEAILVVGYRKEEMLGHFGRFHGTIRLIPVEQQVARGTADALRAARDALGGPALVINGDDFYHADDLARVAEERPAILAKPATDPWNRAAVDLTGDGWLLDVVEKPTDAQPGALSSIGAYSLDREDLEHLGAVGESVRGELELPDLIRILVRVRGVRVVRSRMPWLPLTYAWDLIGRVAPLFEGGEATRTARALGLDWEEIGGAAGVVTRGAGACIHPDARLAGAVALGASARIGSGAVVERAVLLDGAEVGRGAVVRDSVLGFGARVGEGARLRSGPVARIRVLDHLARPGVERIGACLGDDAVVEPGAETPPGALLGPGQRFPDPVSRTA